MSDLIDIYDYDILKLIIIFKKLMEGKDHEGLRMSYWHYEIDVYMHLLIIQGMIEKLI